jgi:PadR family transcriptional regulator PadR
VSLLQLIWRKNAEMPPESAIVQRTLEMLVLKALSLAPMHGWGIGQRIDQLSKGAFQVPQGSLYPALVRMRRQGWIRSEWRVTENNRRARYYLLTPAGRKQLGIETDAWERASEAVNAFLRTRTLEDTP